MPDDPNKPDLDAPLTTLSADGKLEGEPLHRPAPPPVPVIAAPKPEPPIELAERPRRPDWQPPPTVWRPEPPDPRKGRATRIVIAAVGIGLLLLAAALIAGQLGPKSGVRPLGFLEGLLTSPGPPMVIDSEPPGATVTISGKIVGQTPWAGENRWVGDAELVLTRPGYMPWKKKFSGRQETHVSVTLKPAR